MAYALTPRRLAALSMGAALWLAQPAVAAHFAQTNLVTDDQAALTALGFDAASNVDPHLINPWGVSFGATGPFWVSNQGDNTSTLYNGAGAPQALVVSTPTIEGGGPLGPTGQVFNGGGGFNLANGNSGLFLFANLDGSISGWNPANGTTATRVVPQAGDGRAAIYTGLALGAVGTDRYLYAANGATGQVDVFDSSFTATTLAGAFDDPGANPDGLVPFNVSNIGGHIFVTYAQAGPDSDEAGLGSGFVSEFDSDGTFIRRLTEGGPLSSPWGLAIAPDTFGDLAGALLVGNFSDEFGQINAFSLVDGSFLGAMLDADGNAITIPYLWSLTPGNGGNAGSLGSIYFTAGIGDEAHGLLGEFAATAVPEPATWAMMLVGFGVIGGTIRRRRELVPRPI